MRPKIWCDGESCKIFGILKNLNTAFVLATPTLRAWLKTKLTHCPTRRRRRFWVGAMRAASEREQAQVDAHSSSLGSFLTVQWGEDISLCQCGAALHCTAQQACMWPPPPSSRSHLSRGPSWLAWESGVRLLETRMRCSHRPSARACRAVASQLQLNCWVEWRNVGAQRATLLYRTGRPPRRPCAEASLPTPPVFMMSARTLLRSCRCTLALLPHPVRFR
jgi:hypothetical protein